MNKNYPEAYQKTYEILTKINDILCERPGLDNPEVDLQLDKITGQIYRLYKIVKINLIEYDKEKLDKWAASNR